MSELNLTPWLTARGGIDEHLFCKDYLIDHKMIYADGAFFTEEGRITDESRLRREIYERLRDYVTSNIHRKVENILNVLRLECRKDSLPLDEKVIHVANGTYHTKDGFSTEKQFCRHRLPVNYRPHGPEPVNWLNFLHELLDEEDIWTLQQFMGYCLIPTTKAQKMLIITGKGGEGKSRIGVVMKAMLGNNMNVGSISKVETNPFARADLEHLLVLVDDDLKLEALNQTNYIKSIITAELPMDLEKKGVQSYQGKLNVRFMAFGNGSLQALHDRSYGFFRRQIILSAKERRPDRVDDPYLAEKLTEEIDGIFYWALLGLHALIGANYRFYISEKTRANMEAAMAEGNNLVDFMKAEGYFRYDRDGRATSRALYNVYRDWCEDNALPALGAKTFWNYLRQNASDYGLTYTYSVPIGNGKRARGFSGIRLCPRM